jgi:hypothetical protein
MKRLIPSTPIALSIIALFALGAIFASNGKNAHLGFVPAVQAQEQEAAERELQSAFPRKTYCTLGTVQGSYGYTAQGAFVPGAPLPPGLPPGPYAGGGLINLDGFGNLTITNATDSFNGVLISTPTIPGQYTVNSDCTGSAATALGAQFKFTIVNGGREIVFVQTTPGSAITGTAKKL